MENYKSRNYYGVTINWQKLPNTGGYWWIEDERCGGFKTESRLDWMKELIREALEK